MFKKNTGLPIYSSMDAHRTAVLWTVRLAAVTLLCIFLLGLGTVEGAAVSPPITTVAVSAGPFSYPLSGDPPAREVWVSAFRIDATEVTSAAFSAYAAATGVALPEQPEGAGPRHPVVNVTWEEATAYCLWRGGTLPTETQWLKAALGGANPAAEPWLDAVGERCANVDETDGADQFEGAAPVASFAPNGTGLYDMVGNATEWVRDGFRADYPAIMPARDPVGPEPPGEYRVLRGFGWYHCTNRIDWVVRNYAPPSKRHIGIGFRCVSQPGTL